MEKQIKLGVILGYVNIILNIIITLAYTPFMLKLMGQSEYGLYALAESIIAYFSVLDMGFGNAMIRFVSRAQAKNNGKEAEINGLFIFLYSIIGIIALILGSIIFVNITKIFSASLTITELNKTKILFLILLINVALSFPLSVFDSYVAANEKFVFSRLITIFRNILKPLIMLPLLFFGYKSIAMASTMAGINILCHLAMLIYCFKILKIKIKLDIKNLDTQLLKEIGIYSFFIFLNMIADNILTNSDQVILGIVSGTISVSIYAIASQISKMNTQFSTIIMGLFLPKITKLLEKRDGEKQISDLFIKVSRIQLYIMMLILSGFIVFGKNFIILWAGKEYIDAYYIILLLIVPVIVPLTQNLGIPILQAKNMHKFRAVVSISIAILNIGISIPLAKMYNGIGAAIGTAFSNIVGQTILLGIYYYKKAKLDIPKYWRFFLKFCSQIIIYIALFMIIISSFKIDFIMLIILATIFCLIYFFIVYINMNEDERKLIKNIINKCIKNNWLKIKI